VQYQRLSSELVVGGVYLRLFLKHPRHPLRDPLRTGEALLDTLVTLLGGGGTASSSAAAAGGTTTGLAGSPSQVADAPALVTAAAVALLSVHQHVGDHLTQLGYVGRLMALLAARRPPAQSPASPPVTSTANASAQDDSIRGSGDGLGQGASGGTAAGEAAHVGAAASPASNSGSTSHQGKTQEEAGAVLKVVHALVLAGLPACEALAAYTPPGLGAGAAAAAGGAVGVLGDTRGWGLPSDLLVLEILRRALGPSNRARDVLVAQALACGLVPALLNLLDWRPQATAGTSQGTAEQQTAIVVASGVTSTPAAPAAEQGGQQQGLGMSAPPQEVAVVRALAVDVLTALCYPGAHAAQVCMSAYGCVRQGLSLGLHVPLLLGLC
jgi:hypothetical protein